MIVIYIRRIFLYHEIGIDLAPYEMFENPKFTHVVQADNENLLIIEYFMIIEKDEIGLFMKTFDNSFRIILGNEANPYIYRGENDEYGNFVPSLQRPMDEKEHALVWIKKNNLKKLLKKRPILIDYHKWKFMETNLNLI